MNLRGAWAKNLANAANSTQNACLRTVTSPTSRAQSGTHSKTSPRPQEEDVGGLTPISATNGRPGSTTDTPADQASVANHGRSQAQRGPVNRKARHSQASGRKQGATKAAKAAKPAKPAKASGAGDRSKSKKGATGRRRSGPGCRPSSTARPNKSILKTSSGRVSKRTTRPGAGSAGRSTAQPKVVTIATHAQIVTLQTLPAESDDKDDDDTTSASTSSNDTDTDTDSDSDSATDTDTGPDPDPPETMSDAPPPPPLTQRPSLKLKLSKPVVPRADGIQPVQTPGPVSATPSGTRTPSIKLKFGGGGGTPHPGSADSVASAARRDTITVTPTSAAAAATKKRKRPSQALADSDDELARTAPAPPKPSTVRRITLTTPQELPKPVKGQTLKLKSKGKLWKRPLGVGYDSELEERDQDPVIHEGFVLRMQPGDDCDLLRKAIAEGTIGQPRAKGGPEIRMRFFDTMGRRGILHVRSNMYAICMVDLPCIVEGMKSWDKKAWIKSVDVNQMILVLGRCYSEPEAKSYALPPTVDPSNHQYAHGLTAPMTHVRKRRFARTRRTRVDDIEAVERRVNALLEADRAAIRSRYQLLDHDPRLAHDGSSSEYEDDDDDDAEGEQDDETDGYFDTRNGQHGGLGETPLFTEHGAVDIGQEDVDEFERMFAGADDGPAHGGPAGTTRPAGTHLLPDTGESSFAVTSTSASPSVTVAQTPASAAGGTSDDEDDDAGDDEEDEDEDADADRDDAEREGDEKLQQAREQIDDMEHKIAEQTEQLKQSDNAIVRRKLARKIQELKDDVAMKKKNAGLGGEDDDD